MMRADANFSQVESHLPSVVLSAPGQLYLSSVWGIFQPLVEGPHLPTLGRKPLPLKKKHLAFLPP